MPLPTLPLPDTSSDIFHQSSGLGILTSSTQKSFNSFSAVLDSVKSHMSPVRHVKKGLGFLLTGSILSGSCLMVGTFSDSYDVLPEAPCSNISTMV